MTPTWKLAPLLLALSAVTPISIADEFSDVYQSYEQAVKEGNNADAILYAEKAYLLGEAKFGRDSLDYANLGLNFALALGRDRKGQYELRNQQAMEVAKVSLVSYESHFGKGALEIIKPLMVIGDASTDNKLAHDSYHRALTLAEDSDNKELLAQTRLNAFKRLSTTEYYTTELYRGMINSFAYFDANLPASSDLRLEAAFWLAKAYLGNKKYDKAEPLFLEVVKQYKAKDYSHPYALAAHSRLVTIYEGQGESDRATEHCIAIGSMRPWDENQEQTPLFRKAPKYPESLAKRGRSGWVQISFTIDEMGIVRDPKLLDSKGGKGFEKASLEALSAWRYAPKFEDGKPVKAESTVRLDFEVER
ncbi:TonB family protein [Shewanella sp.]|uniref:TonB family protein n=1 Tax=Shewanella sp. TaxID=50422 RepID=UPI003569F72C